MTNINKAKKEILQAEEHAGNARAYLEGALEKSNERYGYARAGLVEIAKIVGYPIKGSLTEAKKTALVEAVRKEFNENNIRAAYEQELKQLKDKHKKQVNGYKADRTFLQERLAGTEATMNDLLRGQRDTITYWKDEAKSATDKGKRLAHALDAIVTHLGGEPLENLSAREIARAQEYVEKAFSEVQAYDRHAEEARKWLEGKVTGIDKLPNPQVIKTALSYAARKLKLLQASNRSLSDRLANRQPVKRIELEASQAELKRVQNYVLGLYDTLGLQSSRNLGPAELKRLSDHLLQMQETAAQLSEEVTRLRTKYEHLEALKENDAAFLEKVRAYLLTTELKSAAPEIVGQEQVMQLLKVVVNDLLENRELYTKLQAHDTMAMQKNAKRTDLVHKLSSVIRDAKNALNNAILAEDPYTIMEFIEGSANTIQSSEDLAEGILAYVRRADARQHELEAQKKGLEAHANKMKKELADLAERDKRILEASNREVNGFFSEPAVPGWPNGHEDRSAKTIEDIPVMISKTREAYDNQINKVKQALFAQQEIISERDKRIASLDERVAELGRLWTYEVQKHIEDKGRLVRSESEIQSLRQVMQNLQSDPMLTAFERAYARHCNMFMNYEDAQRVAAQTLYAARQPESKLQPEEVLQLVEAWTDRGLGFMNQVCDAVLYTIKHFKPPKQGFFDKFRASPLERLLKKIRNAPPTNDPLQVAAEVLRN